MRREFIQYWQENFKAAKELSEFWAAVVLLGLFIVGLAARFFGFPNPSEILTLDVKVELAGICLTAFLCFIWLPFHTHSVKKREHSKQLADIIANKDAEIQKLQIQLNKLQTTINDDAPKLTVNAGLFLFQDPVGTPYLVLEAKIVNAGKKLVRVEKVVYFTRSTLPTLHGPFEEFLVCANFSSTPTVDL